LKARKLKNGKQRKGFGKKKLGCITRNHESVDGVRNKGERGGWELVE